MLMHLEHDRRSVTYARRWVLRHAADAGIRGEAQATVELLTSELVANALNHGPAGGLITLQISHVDGTFEVAVSDQGLEQPVLNHAPPTAESGRGVMLVDMLADSWGIRPLDGGGKSVWFTVRL
jgi:serine/threonine-protein kinase RsbW